MRTFDQKSYPFHEKDRVLEKKMSSFEKFSNRFFMFGKKSQNLKIFLLERELFHEIDHDFRILARNVMFWPPRRELKVVVRWLRVRFSDPKF